MENELVEFRDGDRWVAGYLAALFGYAHLDTHTMTYEEAVQAANNGLVTRRMEDAQKAAIRNHFRR